MQAKDYIPLIGTLVTGTVAFMALLNSRYVYAVDDRKRRAKEIEARLNEFYSPLLMYVRSINHLYCEFALGFRHQNPNFRTIPYILAGNTVAGNDASLLNTILELESKVEDLIINKSGLIEAVDLDFRTSIEVETTALFEVFKQRYVIFNFERKPTFRSALELLLVHIRILRSVAKGELTGQVVRFEPFTYPRAIDKYLEHRIIDLEQEYKEINAPLFGIRLRDKFKEFWRDQMSEAL